MQCVMLVRMFGHTANQVTNQLASVNGLANNLVLDFGDKTTNEFTKHFNKSEQIFGSI